MNVKKSLIALSLLLGIFSGPLTAPDAMASTAAGFKAGEIMDDTVMTDYNSMTQIDIQNFLNSKVPTCDTNGAQPLDSSFSSAGVPDYNSNGTIQRWEWAKYHYGQTTFPCLRDYIQGGKTSARIIYDTSQTFHINPKVLIVLLQKEQGLVTDTWPLSIQYKTATGYACPDSGTCDTKYYGLTQQLTWAATMFHTIVTNSQSWSNAYGSGTSWYAPYTLGNNSIYWNPSTSCGTSTVNIVNRTTVALYSYTPYRPNQAALNAGYGSGNSCSSYGNRNFYLYFTDWFGSTTIPMFKISGSNTVYLSYGDYYYGIPSMSVLKAWGLGGKKITTISASQVSSYIQGPNLGRAAKFGTNSTVYLIDNGNLYPTPDWATINAYGYTSGGTQTYDDANLMNTLSTQSTLTSLARQSNGSIYFMDNNGKHVFPDWQTFLSMASGLAGTTNTHTFTDDLLSPISDSSPVLLDGSIVKESDGGGIYLFDSGKRWSFSPDGWRAWGKKINYTFTSNQISQLTDGGGLAPVLITDGSSKYLVDGSKKYAFTSNIEAAWGLVDGDFQTVTSRSINTLNPGSNMGTLIRQPDGTVYKVNGGKRYAIPSVIDFNKSGYRWDWVFNLSSSSVSLVSDSGVLAFAPGSLIRLPSGGVYMIDNGLASFGIPSLDSFNNYGFSWKNVRNFGANALSGYTTQTLNNLIETPSSKHYLADNGHVLSISDTVYGSGEFDLASSTKTTLSDNLVSKLNLSGPLTQFVKGSGYTVYKVVSGYKNPISSPQSLYDNGGSWDQITRVSDSFLDTLPTGSML